jgi:hypothetical protein
MIAVSERQYQPVTLYKNTHLRILIRKRLSSRIYFQIKKGYAPQQTQSKNAQKIAQQSPRIGNPILMAQQSDISCVVQY